MKYEKFDIERALAGEPVILRNGAKAYIRFKEEDIKLKYPLMGVVLGEHSNGEFWTLLGTYYSKGHDSDQDIIGMYPKKPLTMPDSFWNMLRPEIEAIAKDGNGAWHGFKESKVQYVRGVWGDGLFYSHLKSYPHDLFPDCKPEDSLIVRPSSGSEI